MPRPSGQQFDMIDIEGKTAYIVRARSADHARLEITRALTGKVAYEEDLRKWRTNGEPVREMGTKSILRGW